MTRRPAYLLMFAMAVLMVPAAYAQEKKPEPRRRDESLLRESRASVSRALRYLWDTQREDGSWRGDPAITAIAVTAMAGSGQQDFSSDSKPVARALEFIRRFTKPDGGIYGEFYPSYTTSVCVMALIEAGRPEDKERIRDAQRFLLGLQADETEGVSPDDPQYGGWGYEPQGKEEGMQRADLSNTQLALEAVRALQEAAEEDTPQGGAAGDTALTETELCFQKAIRYLERCQNSDGGFIYRPGESKAGEAAGGGLRSYGSMTYAGLKSMIYARVDRSDPRVRAAYDWVRQHWTVTENSGLGAQGLFYYYQTMAKALSACGAEIIVDAAGGEHDWRAELLDQLLKTQQADGSWVNANGRWMEAIPELVTGYTVLTIEHATSQW